MIHINLYTEIKLVYLRLIKWEGGLMIKLKLLTSGVVFLFALAAIVFPVQKAHAVEYGCNGPDTFASGKNSAGVQAHATIRTCVEKNHTGGGVYEIRSHSKITCYRSGIKANCQEIGGVLTLWIQGTGLVVSSDVYFVRDRSSLDMYTPYWCDDFSSHSFYGKAGGVQVKLPNGVQSQPHDHNSFPTTRNCEINV